MMVGTGTAGKTVGTLRPVNGQEQRNALTAAEQALRALHKGNHERARQAAARAADLDQIGLYAALPAAVRAAVADLDATGVIGPGEIEALRAAVGPGPVQALVDDLSA